MKTDKKPYRKKCEACGERTERQISKGKLRPDPKHPDKRDYDERDVTTTCRGCGHEVKSLECPYLLADFFSI